LHSFTSSSSPRLAFVDLETTGGTAALDRITEVGIIEVDENGVREWSSLVNPQVPIPPFIQSLTGISNAMVANAPTFAELADAIHARLADRIFIAHNARFDHGFLKSAFGRTGHAFYPSVLCTVRLSRKLYPGFARHNLDSLVERHGLHVSERHRALGDAQVLWQFWQTIQASHAPEVIDEAVGKLISRPSLPSRLDMRTLDALPSSHGVYQFYGAGDVPLYIGKANDLRKRVLQQFSGEHLSAKEMKLSQQIERVSWIATAGELGALLQEAALIRQHKPIQNRRPRKNDEVCAWRLREQDGVLSPVLMTTDDPDFGRVSHLYGAFLTKRKAQEFLKAVADAHGLCHALLGLEKARANKGCFGHQAGKCRGACCGEEALPSHNQRLSNALYSEALEAWPYPGAVAMEENGALHVIDGWAYLGTAASLAEAQSLLPAAGPRFDRDVYQILRNWLRSPERQVIQL
jgi:DNA polymerase III subunit epsilon